MFYRFKPILILSLSTVLLSVSGKSNSESLSAEEIVKKSELAAYYAGDDGRTEARMLIVDNQGRKQVRQFTILRRDQADGGVQDLLVFFSRPADVRDTVFRVIKRTESDDDRWLYLPGLDLVKRISAGDKRTSFVGSHFFYEDVSGRNTEQDQFARLEDSDSHYRLEGTPKDTSSVEFSRYEVEIDKNNFIPTKIEFFDQENRLYRRVQALAVEAIQGFATVTHSRVEDLLNGGATEMQFRQVQYNLEIPESVFSERSLRTPPQQWLN